jgi:ABC-type amino acid transport system permease subunit
MYPPHGTLSCTGPWTFTEADQRDFSNATFQPFMVISLVAVLYFILCWPLSKLASNMEQKFNQTTSR